MRLLNKTISLAAKAMRRCGYSFNEETDLRVQEMRKEIRQLGGSIEFNIEQYPDGSWTAESTNVDGIITGGESTKEISLTIKDAIFTYFGIPPQLCIDNLLRADNEPVTVKQQVYMGL